MGGRLYLGHQRAVADGRSRAGRFMSSTASMSSRIPFSSTSRPAYPTVKISARAGRAANELQGEPDGALGFEVRWVAVSGLDGPSGRCQATGPGSGPAAEVDRPAATERSRHKLIQLLVEAG